MDNYTIKSGDNLTKLAQQFGTTVGALTQSNNISNPNMIKVGQKLTIPQLAATPTTPTSTAPVATTPKTTVTTTQAPQPAPTPTAINVQTAMNPQQPVAVPSAIPSVTPTTTNEADRILQAIQTEDTATQKFADKQSLDIASLTSQLLGESEARTAAFNEVGITQKKQEYQNLSSQILNKQAEIAQDDIQLLSNLNELEKKAITGIAIKGQQRSVTKDAQLARALKVAEIGVLNAQVLAKQGDIQLAMETAQNAVDAKYAPIREQIDVLRMQLEAIQPILSKDEKKQAQAQQIKLGIEERRIQSQAETDKTIQNLMLEASKNGAPQSVLNSVSKATSVREAIQKMGKYSTDPLDRAIKSAQLSKINQDMSLARSKFNAEKQVSVGQNQSEILQLSDFIKKAQNLATNKKGIKASSGTLQRKAGLSNDIRDWRADATSLISRMGVDELGRIKLSGVTFGNLTESERQAFTSAASALTSSAKTDKNGNYTGYFSVSESKLKEELGKMEKVMKADFERKTGMNYDSYSQSNSLENMTEEDYVNSVVSNAINSSQNVYGEYID